MSSDPSTSMDLVQNASQSIVAHQNCSNYNQRQQRRKILPEEEFTSTLNKIITRDYYPSIPSLHRDLSVLQKRREGDTAGAIAIRRAARKLESIEEQEKLDEYQEEMNALLNNGGIRKRPRPLERESIDGFHSRVTSEDNAYFEENMEREVKEKKDIMGIIYGTRCATMAEKGKVPLLLQNYAANGSKALPASSSKNHRILYDESPFQSASDQFNAPVERIQAAGTTKDGQSISETNSLFFAPQHITNHQTANISSSTPTLCYGWDSNKNMSDAQMMPPPPSRKPKIDNNKGLDNSKALIVKSDRSIHNIHGIHDQRHHLVEYRAKSKSRELVASSSSTTAIARSNEKEIIAENTRFQYQNKTRIVASSTVPTVPPRKGTHDPSSSYETDSSVNTDLDAPLRPIHEERKSRLKQIQKERNTLVAMTPTIVPGIAKRKETDIETDGDETDSPIITWGQIASTPLVSSGETLNQVNPGGGCFTSYDIYDDNNPNEKSFQLPSIDSRENAARKVEAKLAKQKQRFEEAGEVHHKSKPGKKTKKDDIKSSTSICERWSQSSSSSMLRREESLTPAARSLLERSKDGLGLGRSSSILNPTNSSIKVNARSNTALGSALRASYTPKLQRKTHGSSKTRLDSSSSLIHKATPLSSMKSSAGPRSVNSAPSTQNGTVALNGERGKKTSSLTSGLLNI